MRGAPPSRSRVSSSRRADDDADDDRAPPPTLAERERASFATLRATHLDAVDAMVRQLDALSDEESRAREAFEAEWDARLADFRARRDALEAKMRDRHRDALEATRETLERALAGAPSRWSPQLEEMRRSRKSLVRHKRFGEALDLLQRVSDKEAEEIEAHRERVRAENARALERAFERHREERAVLAREADAEEERIKARRAKALRAATREWGRRAEDEAARRLASLAAGHQSPSPGAVANRAKTKSKTSDRDGADRDDADRDDADRDDADRDDADDVDDAAARAYGLGARRFESPPGIWNGADHDPGSDRSPGPTRLPPGAYANADVLFRRRRRRSESQEPESGSPPAPSSPSPGESASIRSPRATVHLHRSDRASARGTSPGGSSAVSPARSDASAALAFYQNLGGGADMLRLSYSARGDDASRDGDGHGRDTVSRDAIPPRGGDAWLEDGRFPEDAGASRRGVGADVVHPAVIGSIPADAFDPALQHMVSLEQRRAWEEMRRRRAMMDDAHAAWIARARAEATTRGHHPPGFFHPGDPRVAAGVPPSRVGFELAREASRSRASPTPPRHPGPHPGRVSPPPATGASGASARRAAEDLMAAAMAMAGTSNRPPPASTADRKREEERVADARRRAIAGDASESESDVDDDELDDIDLVARTPARLRDGDSNRRGRSEGSGRGAVGPALDLRGVVRANGGDGSSPPAAPRGIGAVVGGAGASAAAHAVPRVRAAPHAPGDTNGHDQPSDSRTRGVAADRAPPGARDPLRDFPREARGAALLRRMPGPEDGYRSRRETNPDANLGELGFPESPPAPVVKREGNGKDSSTARGAEQVPSLSLPARETTKTEPAPPAPPAPGPGVDSALVSSREFEEAHAAMSSAATPPRVRRYDLAAATRNAAGLSDGARAVAASTLAARRDGDEAPRADSDSASASASASATESESSRRSAATAAATAAARMAAFRYGGVAPAAPTVSSFGQPLASVSVSSSSRPPPPSAPSRKVQLLGDDVDPASGLRKRAVGLGAIERVGMGRGEILRDPFDDAARRGESSTLAAAPTTAADVPALFKHVRKGAYDEARKLFKRGIDPDCRDRFDNTPLIVACQNGAGRIAKLCLRHGADVDAVNRKRNSALHFCVQYGFHAMADWLLENGADRDIVNDAGQTAYQGIG
jgi:hypothetical protein